MKQSLILWTFLLAAPTLPAQETPDSVQQTTACPCCEGHYLDFDFWVGEWEVFDTTGTLVGTNSIQPKSGNCILEENWKGAKGFIGSSYNYFNKQDSTWNQVWIDFTGSTLVMQGGLQGANMVLQTAPATSEQGVVFFNRITWKPQEDGSVHQVWEIINAQNGSLIQLAFYGIYRRK